MQHAGCSGTPGQCGMMRQQGQHLPEVDRLLTLLASTSRSVRTLTQDDTQHS